MPKHLKIIIFLFVALFALAFVGKINTKKTVVASTIKPVVDTRPNVIVILVDDAGYVDFGFMGSKDLGTPNIDALAKSGAIFTDAHVSSTVCAPSRAGLITGKYQQRFGFEANHTGDSETGDIGLAANQETIASVFKNNNYKTVAIGKWHLGATKHNHPNNRGFQDFFGFLGGARSYFPKKDDDHEKMLQYNGKKVDFKGYLTDEFGDFGAKYIRKKSNQPFFMYLAFNAVHTPMEAKEEDLQRFENHPRKKLAAMTYALDQNVGKIINALKETNALENTLIFFLSDNGGSKENKANNGILKGWKGNEFEGGHRVPFVMSWPKKIPQNFVFDGLSSSLDIFKTSLAAADITYNQPLDGVNLLPYLEAKSIANPHKYLYWRKLEESAVRFENFKMVRLENYGATLYDLATDIKESKDLSQVDTVTYNLIKSKLKSWENELMKPLWKEDEDWMLVTYHIHKRLMQNKEALYTKPKTK